MTDIIEFIVESVDESDETWKFFNTTYKLTDANQNPSGQFSKKFTSMATNATIFRWRFGEGSNPIVETTLNPYIHRFHGPGTYNVSHQSCYPCTLTSQLVCSNGWCTKSVTIVSPSDNSALIATAGLFGLFIIAKENNCCKLRDMCTEKREICKGTKSEDIENIKE